MEVSVVKSEKDYLEVDILGEDHTLGNIIRKELWNVKGVKEAGYIIKHPLISCLRISVRTEDKPKKAFHEAVSLIKSQIKEVRNLTKKL
jgi:DNA-directed RNA polymerase subunit L